MPCIISAMCRDIAVAANCLCALIRLECEKLSEPPEGPADMLSPLGFCLSGGLGRRFISNFLSQIGS